MANSRGPLEHALAARDCDAVRKALADGVDDVNAAFGDGLTPLCRIAALGDWRILKLLLAAKADIDVTPGRAKPKEGATGAVADYVADAGFAALHWASRENKLDCANLLLEAGATIDVRAADDVTPFMLACKGGHHECARALARAGADVEAVNVRGGSAMVVACVMGEAETVRLLLNMSANADACTVALDDADQPFQCRPLVTACRYNQPKCISLLLSAGVSHVAMTTALTELEAFPSFHESARLVRRAVERSEQRQRGGHGRVASTGDAADMAAAEARAEAAMVSLLEEELEEGGGRRPSRHGCKADSKAGCKGRRPPPLEAPASPTTAPVAMAAATVAKKRRKTRKKSKKGAGVEADAEDEPDEPDGTSGERQAEAAFPAANSGREGGQREEAESNMHALVSEYQQYQADSPPSAAASPGSSNGGGGEADERIDEFRLDNPRMDERADDEKRQRGERGWRDDDAADQSSDGANQSDYEQLDLILRQQEVSELDLFLRRKKFTMGAMSFFLSKVRDGSASRALEAGGAPPANDSTVAAAAKATRAGPPTPPKPPKPPKRSPSEERRLRRKASRPPPPADFLPHGLASATGDTDSDDTERTLQHTTKKAARANSTSTFCELERRLEEELDAAREREAALQATLRQHSEALSELVVCPITQEPMVDPVSAADGQTYERRAIEEWLTMKGAVPTSPLTGEPLQDKTLRPNFLARALRAASKP